jgi:hypothetical protein
VLATFPNNGAGLEGSFAGMIGQVLLPIFRPIGFNLEMVVALVPGMAAREAAVSSLGLIYSLGDVDQTSEALRTTLNHAWTLPMALSFIAWYVYAPQCFATLATVRRDGIEAKGGSWSAEEEAKFKQPLLDQFARQSHPYYASARLWDDGVIDPADTRQVLALALSASLNAPIPDTRFGVFRM